MGGRNLRFFIAGLFLIMSIGFISAYACSLQTSCAEDNTIMKLSSTTNAHGEFWDGTAYTKYLCCDFTGTHICGMTSEGEANKVLGLSDITNAHAEIPEKNNLDYQESVCFGDLICIDIPGACTTDFPIQTVSLSSDTNAHLAEYNFYGINICCQKADEVYTKCATCIDAGNPWCLDQGNNGCEVSGCITPITNKVQCPGEAPLIPDVYWADEDENKIDTSQTYTYLIGDILKLVAINLEPGIEAIFEIYEDDSPFGPDEIRVGASALPTTTVNSEGKAVVDWIISSADEQAGLQSGNDPPFEFYFKVNSNLEGEELIVNIKEITEFCDTITLCEHYPIEQCNSDSCNVNATSVPDYIDCSLEEYYCRCVWEEGIGCVPKWDAIEDDPDNPGTPLTIGTCTYITDDLEDDCDDGYLSYGWEGVWTWAAGNEITRYDPKEKQALCEDSGVTTVMCPAQIELPFLGTWGIIVTIGLIVLIYVVLNLKKQKVRKPKKATRKKK